MKPQVQQWLTQLTVEEKASLCSGMDTWHTQAIDRLGIPAIMLADGPHGLRKQVNESDNLGLHGSISAVCFPAACATACSFDKALLREMGTALGEECQAENVAVLLGPGANIKRSPLCGRNFEYFSEDPHLSAQMAAAFIQGVQHKGVGTSLKHFAANNQETRRMSVSANIDTRTLREIYLASFEDAVKDGKPSTIMCSYNRLNGNYTSQDPFLLNQVLREEWGYTGCVVSDWGAVNERVPGLAAGLDLEMPDSGDSNAKKIVAAVQNGSLSESVLDQAVVRILDLVATWQENHMPDASCDWEAHHNLARRIASESTVLLKNENHTLPLQKGGRYAFIGAFAASPRYQGGGSSHINSSQVESALDCAKDQAKITYVPGYDIAQQDTDVALLQEALDAAKAAEVAVIFAGLPESFESEGFDREHMEMPQCQNELIAAVAAVQPNVVVVLHNGAPVAMPWFDQVPALLETYLGGQAVGGATCDILFGDVNPSGKLAESFPHKLQDTPAYLNFPGDAHDVDYREGVFVGYRYYDKKDMPVLFPFGHGLSYTSFSYEDIRLSADAITDQETLEVSVRVKNTGRVAGKEVVQLYVADRQNTVTRPARELKGFEKVFLLPGEAKTVTFHLEQRAFAYWNSSTEDWQVQSGMFTIFVGASSRNLPLQADVQLQSTKTMPRNFHINSTMGELLQSPHAAAILQPQIQAVAKSLSASLGSLGENSSDTMRKMMLNLPLRGWISLTKIPYTQEMFEEMFREEEA